MPESNVIAGAAAELGERPAVELFDVWDLEGKLHRVSAGNRADALTHLKWFDREPISAAAAIVAAVEKKTEAAVAAIEAKVIPDKEDAPADSKVDLASMSREGLARYAMEHFKMEVSENWSHGQILDAVMTELGD
jgi:hypothetical protein